MNPTRLLAATLVVLTVPSAQAQRPPVQLEAADCSRMNMMWDDYQVAHAVQHAFVPMSVGTLDVQPGGNGGVKIERGSGDAYSITACIAAAAETRDEAQRAADAVKLSIDRNRVRVENRATDRRVNVQIIVEAPRAAQINVETNNGPIGIEGVQGRVTATASNGPISIADVDGQVNATASNGPISVSGNRGDFDVETRNGPISVDLRGNRWDGKLTARAHNGPLSVKIPERYTSGVEISSSSNSPWSCRLAECRSTDHDWRRGPRTLRLGGDPIVVRISTGNGPVAISTAR